MKILVVDDDDGMRAVYLKELGLAGYDVRVAENGYAGLKRFKEDKPDLVVLDLRMPGMDGLEVMGRMLAQHRTIPIVLASSHMHYKENYLSWAADAYINKSADLSELKTTIRNLLAERYHLPQQQPAAENTKAVSRVLIIEDNVDAAETLQTLLSILGHSVQVAHSATEGLRVAREFHPGIVLCDIALPGHMDGYGLARAMRKDPQLSSATLIAMTGYDDEEDRRRAHEAGFDHHLTKPAELHQLEQLLASA